LFGGLYLIGGSFAREESVIRVVIFPLAVSPGEDDILLCQPIPNLPDRLATSMIVDHIRVRKVALEGRPNRVVLID